jgi:2-oxoisovalerate dehydrogenase E2 component (dihydrolipoyl transacylase)
MGRFTFKLPDVGEGVAEAEVVAWHVAVGDAVAEDQPLADVMTDKATVELTSPVAGKVLERNGAEGDTLAVGAPLVVLETEGETPAEPVARAAPKAEPAAAPAPAPPAREAAAPAVAEAAPPEAREAEQRAPSKPSGQVLAAPAVRARAEALGLDLSAIRGTGPEGRVTHADLDAVLTRGGRRRPSGPAFAQREGAEAVKVIGLRRRIAEKMQDAKRRIPHFAYVEAVDVTDLEALRAHLNAAHSERPRLTLLPFLIRALVVTLPEFPQINATFDDEAGVITRHAPVHVGIATQTPGGLMVPVVRHAETLDLWAAAEAVARAAAAAREGKAAREDLTGSTITITSLGPLGGIATTPIINAPEVAIIGPNKIVEQPVIRDGQIVVRKLMNLSSSFDHRVVDGYDAAAFIQRIKGLLEVPATLFLS